MSVEDAPRRPCPPRGPSPAPRAPLRPAAARTRARRAAARGAADRADPADAAQARAADSNRPGGADRGQHRGSLLCRLSRHRRAGRRRAGVPDLHADDHDVEWRVRQRRRSSVARAVGAGRREDADVLRCFMPSCSRSSPAALFTLGVHSRRSGAVSAPSADAATRSMPPSHIPTICSPARSRYGSSISRRRRCAAPATSRCPRW